MTEKKREKWKNNNCTNQAEVGVCFREKVLERGTVCHSPPFHFSLSQSIEIQTSALLFFPSLCGYTHTHSEPAVEEGKKTLVLDFGINYWFSFPYKFSIVSHYDMLAVCLWKESHSITERTCLSWEEEEKKKTGSQSGDHKHWQAGSSLLFCVNMIEYASRLHKKYNQFQAHPYFFTDMDFLLDTSLRCSPSAARAPPDL